MKGQSTAGVTPTRGNQVSGVVKGKKARKSLDSAKEQQRAVQCPLSPQSGVSDKIGDSQPREDRGAAAATTTPVLGKHKHASASSRSSSSSSSKSSGGSDAHSQAAETAATTPVSSPTPTEPSGAMKWKKGRKAGKKERQKRQCTQESAAPESGFCGKYIGLPVEEAREFAWKAHRNESISDQPTEYHDFWVDASLSGLKSVGAGAAVVYKEDPQSEAFIEDMYYVDEIRKEICLGEMFAIGAGLKTAVARMEERGRPGQATEAKAQVVVRVFSDSQRAMGTIEKGTKRQDPLEVGLVRSVIALSQRLSQMGVEVELRWVKGHERATPGHKAADLLSKAVTRHMQNGVGDRAVIQIRRVDCASLVS
ncbi:hypothetical protein BO70DRAFT_391575 [Aspergillus heteromorphus CBS 117.55]|uniref:RNase H type-1 domain-containing protein n=1 Tax=Aspergillus heteromorphus CBS 117.55 TaxID=1448321 RepID=A0A317X1F4_9EURO|nr:uncharacterized protein BO70DRAFT_391575 [Aspergillus heteromorphus CBS 117.55]PWY92155.1 hypothetical protein BO70DRAFT_391575 [Aspergillus heteromorphus CBS 117.55]